MALNLTWPFLTSVPYAVSVPSHLANALFQRHPTRVLTTFPHRSDSRNRIAQRAHFQMTVAAAKETQGVAFHQSKAIARAALAGLLRQPGPAKRSLCTELPFP